MGLSLVELGLLVILVAVLIGPFIAKKIEQNFEAYLLLMSLCAVALSRSWRLDIVEEAVSEPLLVSAVLIILLAGAILRYRRPHFEGLNHYLQDGTTLKVIFFEIVVVLGLLASILTPILLFFVLMEVVNHLPLKRKTQARLTILACISICLGAIMALVEEPYSTLAVMKMQGALPSANFLPLEMQNLYLMLFILVLGLTSMFLVGEKVTDMEIPASEDGAPLITAAIWSVRVCMFAAAILLVGVSFGVNF